MNPTQDFGTRIRGITYDAPVFKDAAEFKAAFEEAVKGAHDAAEKKFRAEGDLILYVAKIQSYLSERGANAHLRKAAGIPAGFERWYTEFRAQYDVEFAFKTIQHKIAQLHGGCEHCGRLTENDADHKKSCILYRPLLELAEPGEKGGCATKPHLDTKETANAYLADRCLSMIGLLTNAPKDTAPEQIFATIRAEAESAYEELDAETAKKIKIPKLVKLPDADYTNLKTRITALKTENDSLRQRLENLQSVPESLRDENITANLAAEPDTDRATDLLEHYLQTVVERILPPNCESGKVDASVKIVGRDDRIMPGDWLRQQDRYTQGAPMSLAKCTGIAEFMSRRRVWEWENGEWGKEHVLLAGDG